MVRMNLSRIHSFIVKITTECNLACSYCYYLVPRRKQKDSSLRVMPLDLLKDIIRQICELPIPHIRILIHGGEPLCLGREYLTQVFALKKDYKCEKRMEVNIQTNGTLINESWIRLFRKWDIGVGISLDGPSFIHDTYRLNLYGGGSYNDVMRTIRLMRDSGMAPFILAVVTKEAASCPEQVYDFFFHMLRRELPVFEVEFHPCRLIDPETGLYDSVYSLPPKQWFYFLKVMLDLSMEEHTTDAIRYLRHLTKVLRGYTSHICDFAGGCARFITIEPNGDVFPCEKLLMFEDTKLGNVAVESLDEILASAKFASFLANVEMYQQNCRLCEWFNICHGGCIADRYASGFNVSSPDGCDAKQEFLSYAFRKIMAGPGI